MEHQEKENNNVGTVDSVVDPEVFQIHESVMISCVDHQTVLNDLIASLKEQ